MNKEWFLDIALKAPPTPLSGLISNILQSTSSSKEDAISEPSPPLQVHIQKGTSHGARATAPADHPTKSQAAAPSDAKNVVAAEEV
jgi:hypothetical protein